MGNKTLDAKNILFVANFKSDVGYAWWLMENFWAEIARHFQNTGRSCILLYPKVNSIPAVISSAPIEIIEYDFSDRSFSSIIKLLGIIESKNIGYIYLTDRPYYDWLYMMMRLAGVRKIIDHDHTPGERSLPSFFIKVVKKLIHTMRLFSCNHYIGVSQFVKKRMIESACIPESRCSYVHNGIILFDNTKTYYAHDTFGIPKDSRIVVTTGRATFYKGIDRLIKCAHILLIEKGLNNLYFLHIGNGPDLDRFKEMTIELGIDDKFLFAGFRNDIPKILPSCDIGIQASQGEAFSLSIIEYMCAGLATLAPNNCGNSEAIEDGVNGILFKPGDMGDIVNKIIYILNDPFFFNKIKEAARISVLEKFTIGKCNENLISLLDMQIN